VRSLAPREASLGEALALGPVLLSRAASERVPWIAATVVRGPAVLLGAGQRAGRVVRLDACAAAGTPVFRRATAGTAAFVERRAIVWTLALPHVAALVVDATPRTLLNRNVRGFLKGFRQAGAAAHYFGREWISVRHRPAALLGFEATPEGAVLIEVVAGVEASIALPEALATAGEQAVDRWLGKVPAGLAEVMAGDPLEIAGTVMSTVSVRAAEPDERMAAIEVAPLSPVTREDDPMPEGFVARPGERVPIGWIDVGVGPSGEAWIGGDVLVPAYARTAMARGEDLGDVPVDGATLADLRAAVRRSAP
jgi:hypothetical protein